MSLCEGRTFHVRILAITKFLKKDNVLQEWLEVTRVQIMWGLIGKTLMH